MITLKIVPLKIEGLSPINYYYIAAAGSATGGMRTSSFIGDIALKYATLRQLGELDYNRPDKFQPTYEELNKFSFWFTVAVSEKVSFGEGSQISYMKNMIRNTMQGIDYNGSNKYPGAKEGSNMYKNFYFQQPLAPGNVFYCYLISKEKMAIPEALRVGNGKTGLLRVSTYQGNEFSAVINLFTLNKIMGIKVPERQFQYSENLLLQYYLAGMYKIGELEKLYGYIYN